MTSALSGNLKGAALSSRMCVSMLVYNSLRLRGMLLATVSQTTLHLFLPSGLKHNKRI